MVFRVFLEVLEMSSEVVGPGPNTREIKSLRVDPGPLACVQGLPAHDYNTTNHPPLVAPTTCQILHYDSGAPALRDAGDFHSHAGVHAAGGPRL